MEGLRLVEAVAVRGSVLISVLILLSPPGVAVPELAVALVAASKGVGALLDLQAGRVLEHTSSVASSPVGLVVLLRAQVAGPSGGRGVVVRLVVAGRVEHGAGSVAAAAHFHGDILLGDQLGVGSVNKVKPMIIHAQ